MECDTLARSRRLTRYMLYSASIYSTSYFFHQGELASAHNLRIYFLTIFTRGQTSAVISRSRWGAAIIKYITFFGGCDSLFDLIGIVANPPCFQLFRAFFGDELSEKETKAECSIHLLQTVAFAAFCKRPVIFA